MIDTRLFRLQSSSQVSQVRSSGLGATPLAAPRTPVLARRIASVQLELALYMPHAVVAHHKLRTG